MKKVPDGKKDFENNVDTEKKNVTVTNTGNVDAFIRAAIIVTWKDSAGNIAATVPVEGYDYNLKLTQTIGHIVVTTITTKVQ